jgi:hypothetical protein
MIKRYTYCSQNFNFVCFSSALDPKQEIAAMHPPLGSRHG